MKYPLLKSLSLISLCVPAVTIVSCSCNKDKEPESEDFSIPLELPVMKINTSDGQPISSKTTYKDVTITISNSKEEYSLSGVGGKMRGRGNASWQSTDKKSYRINFNEKTSVFGSKNKFKKWNLIGNFCDRSLLRNYMAYLLYSKLNDISFAPSVNNVDLYINGDYRGVYLLTDQIEVKNGRVNIDDSIQPDGNNGYLLEQTGTDRLTELIEDQDWFRDGNGIVYEIKSPDTSSAEFLANKDIEINYIKSFCNSVFTALASNDWEQVTNIMNVNSFADGYIIEELFANLDCYIYSMYYYRDKNGKFTHGPVWDFDRGGGNTGCGPGTEESCPPDAALWAGKENKFYLNLLKYDEFKSIVTNKLKNFKNEFLSAIKLLDTSDKDGLYSLNSKSFDRNFRKWQIMGKELIESPRDIDNIQSVKEQISFLKNWLEKRFIFLENIYK